MKDLELYDFGVRDYDPFGMLLSGRNWSTGSGYRYGFNGKEKDNDISGPNNSLDFGDRIYDCRLGRWLSTDPLMKKYPNFTPYGYTLNNPIMYLDLGGKDVGVSIEKDPSGVGGKIILSSTIYVTAPTATQAADAVDVFNKAFTKWEKNEQNLGTYTDEHGVEWQVEIKMEFKVATQEDIERITAAKQGEASENLITIDPETERSHAENASNDNTHLQYIPLSNGYPDAKSEYQLGMRMARMKTGDGGNTAIHEVLHLYGLKDRYSDGYYEVFNSETGDFLYTEGKYSHPHEDYEDNVMGASHFGEMNLNKIQIDNLIKAAYKSQIVADYQNGDEPAPTNFVMSRDFLNVEDSDSAIKTEYTENGKTYKNFVYERL